ncbi:CRISP/Allergen/PR-1 [Nymphon striatum]|nr:CRISP/Allergen/PR-1 [Nymphon striatum]
MLSVEWLLQEVINQAIVRDLETVTEATKNKSSELKQERVSLIIKMIKEKGGTCDYDAVSVADEELCGSPETDLYLEDNDQSSPNMPTPIATAELPPIPCRDDILGQVEHLKKQHDQEKADFFSGARQESQYGQVEIARKVEPETNPKEQLYHECSRGSVPKGEIVSVHLKMERDRLLWMLVIILAISLQCISNVKCQACPYKKFTPAHTLCLFQGPNTNCSITDRGMSSKEMKLILDHHNSFRSTVAIGGTKHPTASNMKRLYWDTELATIAQRWTDQCIEGHDCNRCRQVGRFLVGQNLLIEEFDNDPYNPKWSEVITTWYKEVKLVKTSDLEDYKFSNLNRRLYPGVYCLRVTLNCKTLVWAETNKIGCGYTEFRGSPKNKRVYVCNYGPAGNVQMTGVYTQGDSCSDCERYCSAEYPGLCDSSGKKKARFIRPDRYTLLGSCTSRNVGITCLITNLGEVQWRKMPGRRQGGQYESTSHNLILSFEFLFAETAQGSRNKTRTGDLDGRPLLSSGPVRADDDDDETYPLLYYKYVASPVSLI